MRKAVLSLICILLISSGCVKKITGPNVTDHELIRALYSRFETHFNTGNTTQILRLFSPRFKHNGSDKAELAETLGEGTVEIDLDGLYIKLKGIYTECSLDITVEFDGVPEHITLTPETDPLGICFLKKDPAEWLFYGNQQDITSLILDVSSSIAEGWFEIDKTSSGYQIQSYGTSGINPEPVPMYMVYSYIAVTPTFIQSPYSVGASWSEANVDRHGLTWSHNSTITSISESVTTQMGTFEDCIQVESNIIATNGNQNQLNFGSGTRTIWFAPGIGLIKMIYSHNNETTTTCELRQYSVTSTDDDYYPFNVNNNWYYIWDNDYQEEPVGELCTLHEIEG